MAMGAPTTKTLPGADTLGAVTFLRCKSQFMGVYWKSRTMEINGGADLGPWLVGKWRGGVPSQAVFGRMRQRKATWND